MLSTLTIDRDSMAVASFARNERLSMRLIVIRHAIAEDREAFAKVSSDDSKRPLTSKGMKRMRRVCEGLRSIEPQVDTIGTSPYVRAAETAAIVLETYPEAEIADVEELAPAGDRELVLQWLQERGQEETVILVGHEPDLGLMVSWLLASPLNHFVEFKKGGACCLEWPGVPTAGTAWLQWALHPGQLRKIGTR